MVTLLLLFLMLDGMVGSARELEAPNLYWILDTQEKFFRGTEATYDLGTYDQIIQCMHQFDDEILVTSQDLAWKKGFIDYFISNGTESDYYN